MDSIAVQMPDEAPGPEELVTPKEAARLLKGRNLKTIYRLIEKGRLPAWRIVGRLYVRREDVLAFIEPVEVIRPAAAVAPAALAGRARQQAVKNWRKRVRADSRI